MSKSLIARLLVLEERHEGQESPRPALVGIRGISGTIIASIPGQTETEPETFDDEAALEARANELGLQAILVRIVDARRHPTQEATQCTA